MPSNRSTHTFTPADDEERWIAVEPGIPIPQLAEQVHQEIAILGAKGEARIDEFVSHLASGRRPQ